LEDLEDRRIIEKAKRRNAKKPCTPWHEVARELGINPPARKP
jgi:N-glycosylase/DNA lyase